VTPVDIMAGIPNELIRRHASPDEQIQTAKRLAYWLLVKGHRPTLLEIEQERARRANDAA